MSADGGVDKEGMVHVYTGILLSHKEWKNAICSNLDGPGDYHPEWSFYVKLIFV